MNDNYEKIISLGSACVTKIQINLYFNPGENPKNNKSGDSYPFDWLHINDYDLFADAINEDFFKLEDFSTETILTGESAIINTKYNMLWNHVFDDMNILRKIDDTYLKENFHLLKNKINYLTERFHLAKNFKTLYIISDVDYDPKQFKNKPTFENLIKLRDSLVKYRNNNNFTLLYIGINTNFESFENIIIWKNIYPYGSIFDKTVNVDWKNILDKFKF